MPMARPRSPAGKTLVMTARVVGWTAAPPIPITARQAMSSSGLPEKAAITEPPAKTANPMSSTFRRPIRSPMTPQENSRPAKTTM
jgi:hypothetical protein